MELKHCGRATGMCDAFIRAAYDGVAVLTARLDALEAQLVALGLLPARLDRLEFEVRLIDARYRDGVAAPAPVPEPEPAPEPAPLPEPEPVAIPAPIIETAPTRRHPLAGTVSILGGARNG